jgi:hypothetical protein
MLSVAELRVLEPIVQYLDAQTVVLQRSWHHFSRPRQDDSQRSPLLHMVRSAQLSTYDIGFISSDGPLDCGLDFFSRLTIYHRAAWLVQRGQSKLQLITILCEDVDQCRILVFPFYFTEYTHTNTYCIPSLV